MTNPMYEARQALALHPRCGAHARTTGQPCKNPAMTNGRCRIHGGKSTGRPIIHGRTTQKAKRERREIRKLLRSLWQLIGEPT